MWGCATFPAAAFAFVNFSRGQLLDRSWELFDPETVVIELFERVECDCETLSACREMASAGYKLALDDYVADERMRPLVELASIVKIDVLNRSGRRTARCCRPSSVERSPTPRRARRDGDGA